MTYKEKIKNLRNSAQETQAATKIIDKLTDLRSKNNSISSYRWIWELIQNAKDCVNSTGSIDIEIIYNQNERTLVFMHNGKLFSTENIVFLVEQVSTKERSEKSTKKTTGKFGTGFLTTHLLSTRVNVSGYLQDANEMPAKFTVDLDRSGIYLTEIINSIKESCNQLESRTMAAYTSINELDMNTCFKYDLDERGISVAENGLSNFLITAPYVFAFVAELNSITITIDKKTTKYTRTKEGVTQSKNSFVSRIYRDNGETKEVINIFSVCEDDVYVAAEIVQRDGGNHIAPYSPNIPRIFCDFPLLGTQDFSFPVVVNSASFNPNEPRNGIYLADNNADQNKELIKKASTLYIAMINYFVEKGYKDIHNIVCIPDVTERDWLDIKWYNSAVVSWIKEEISKISIFETKSGMKRPLHNASGEYIYLSKDDEEDIRECVWRLSSVLYPNKHVAFDMLEKWYHSLWDECKNYGVLELIENIEKIGDVQTLSKKVTEPIRWLNELIDLIFRRCRHKFNFNSFDFKIFPNQYGKFCSINELKIDDEIDDAFKDAAMKINLNFRKQLLDKRIKVEGVGKISNLTFNDAIHQMIDQAQRMYQEPYDFYKSIIGMKEATNIFQDSFIGIYNYIYHNEPLTIQVVTRTSERLLEIAISKWSEKICKDVEQCNTINNFIASYNLGSNANITNWISQVAQYLVSCKQTELMEQYAILPNQKGEFKRKSELNYEDGLIPEFLKDACCYAGNDIRGEMLSTGVEHTKVVARKITLAKVAEIITKYVRTNKNQISLDDDGNSTFHITYLWLREHKKDPNVKDCFDELLEHLYWFYNDDEISDSITKAAEYTSILQKFGIADSKALEQILSNKTHLEMDGGEISKELLCEYAIDSEEDLRRLIEGRVLGVDFIHESDKSVDKFQYVQQILKRSHDNIIDYLSTLPEYDLSETTDVHKTIFTAKKGGKEIYIIARPSDFDQVILYYGAEIDTLDYTQDFELWVENGIDSPQKLTFGKILRLTGVNRIPLRSIRK